MLLQNGMTLNMSKQYYNKTIVQEDGITNIIDTEHKYNLYNVVLMKNYFDVSAKEELLDYMILDLKSTIKELEQLKEQYIEQER